MHRVGWWLSWTHLGFYVLCLPHGRGFVIILIEWVWRCTMFLPSRWKNRWSKSWEMCSPPTPQFPPNKTSGRKDALGRPDVRGAGWVNQVSRLGSLIGSIDYWIWMITDRTSEQSTWWLVLLNLDDLSSLTQLAIISSIGLGRVSNNTAITKLWFPREFGSVFPTLPWSQHHVVFFLYSVW